MTYSSEDDIQTERWKRVSLIAKIVFDQEALQAQQVPEDQQVTARPQTNVEPALPDTSFADWILSCARGE